MERDLFFPIKTYFEELGYKCDGEVNGIDLYMEKEGVTACCELKKEFDFKVLRQAALRQKVCDIVFIGIFRPKNMRESSFKEKVYLLKRLGIGLIVVSENTMIPELISEPIVTELSRYKKNPSSKAKADRLKKEFKGRTLKNNTGGVNKTPIMTDYRERAIKTLKALSDIGGSARPADVKKLTGIESTGNILRDDHYGWFERSGYGLYSVSEKGVQALSEYADVIKRMEDVKNNADGSERV